MKRNQKKNSSLFSRSSFLMLKNGSWLVKELRSIFYTHAQSKTRNNRVLSGVTSSCYSNCTKTHEWWIIWNPSKLEILQCFRSSVATLKLCRIFAVWIRASNTPGETHHADMRSTATSCFPGGISKILCNTIAHSQNPNRHEFSYSGASLVSGLLNDSRFRSYPLK